MLVLVLVLVLVLALVLVLVLVLVLALVLVLVLVEGRRTSLLLDGVCLKWPGQHINRTVRWTVTSLCLCVLHYTHTYFTGYVLVL